MQASYLSGVYYQKLCQLKSTKKLMEQQMEAWIFLAMQFFRMDIFDVGEWVVNTFIASTERDDVCRLQKDIVQAAFMINSGKVVKFPIALYILIRSFNRLFCQRNG